MQFSIANDMFKQASTYANMASGDYVNLRKYQMQQDQDFSNALSRFVSALASGAVTSTTTSPS